METGPKPSTADMYAAIESRLGDQLDLHHTPQDQLELWAAMDAKALGCAGDVPHQLRYKVLQTLFVVTLQVGAPETCWFNAARLFDTATASMGPTTPTAQVLVRAAAAWLLCYKAEEVAGSGWGIKRVIEYLVHVMATGVVPPDDGVDVSKADILAEERRLLLSHAAEIGQPHIMKWLCAIWLRTDITTRGSCKRVLDGYYPWAVSVARLCTLTTPASSASPPQHQAAAIANTLFSCLGLLPPVTPAPVGAIAASRELYDDPSLNSSRPSQLILMRGLEFATGLSQSDWQHCLLGVLQCWSFLQNPMMQARNSQ